MNIEGLVGGYTGPGGKTILPHRAVAKIDMRLVPDMKKDDAVAALKAHLAKRGFGDIEVNVTGGYDPTSTSADRAADPGAGRGAQARRHRAACSGRATPAPIPATSSPARRSSLAAGHFGLGHGSGAHAPDEYYVIESTNPKVQGYRRRGDVVRGVSVRAGEVGHAKTRRREGAKFYRGEITDTVCVVLSTTLTKAQTSA